MLSQSEDEGMVSAIVLFFSRLSHNLVTTGSVEDMETFAASRAIPGLVLAENRKKTNKETES